MSDTLSNAQRSSLVERLRSGDPDAESELAQLFWGRLRKMLAARIGDGETARDLAQEALLAALTALRAGALREEERLAAFVYGVGRNIANNYLRRQQTSPILVPLEPDSTIDTSRAHNLEERERRFLTERALRVLSPGEREVLTLTLVEGLHPREIAARLDQGVDVIRTRKSRALKKVVAEIQRLSCFAADRH